MSDNTNAQAAAQALQPSPALKRLDKLAGTWNVSGEVQGQITFEWMEGGFFLMQHIDLDHAGHKIKGLEIIGHERTYGAAEPSRDIKSRVYDSEGNTWDYVYELEGDTLTIWAGEKGSPAYFRGKFSDDGNAFSGDWVWPGGGYHASSVRVKK